MSTRRPLRGSPLLVSAAGAVVTIAGACHPPGNLMAPPQQQVCVSVSPKAPVTVNGVPVNEDTGCVSFYRESTFVIDAKLDGYEPYHEEVPADRIGGKHNIVLV